jgi:hypothetical protein
MRTRNAECGFLYDHNMQKAPDTKPEPTLLRSYKRHGRRERLLPQLDQTDERVKRLESPRSLVRLHQRLVLLRLRQRRREIATARRELALVRS